MNRPPPCQAREKEGDDSDPPQKWGVMRPRVGVQCGTPSRGSQGGRYRRYLSLREGSEQPPPEAALGSYLEHVTGDDPGKRDSLMKGLDVFLERDRELFDLPHKENPNGKPS